MDVTRDTTQQQWVLTVSGSLGAEQAQQLRTGLLTAVGDGEPHDVLVDMRAVTDVDDDALRALVRGRSASKHRHRRVVVIDEPTGAAARGLVRTGLVLNFPVFADAQAAGAELAADRTTRDARNAVGGAVVTR